MDTKPFDAIDGADLTPEPSTPIADVNDMIGTLRKSLTGVAVLSHYKKFRNLDDEHRLHIADIIIEREIRSDLEFSIKPDRFIRLTDILIQLFPTEDKETFYVPYRLEPVTKKKICPKGKLYNKFVNYRALLISSGIAKKGNKGKKRKNAPDDLGPARLAFRHNLTPDYTFEYCRQDLEWLQQNTEPWSQVKSLWEKTSKWRIQNLIDDPSVEDYMNTYPALKNTSNGLELINIDFSTIYPEKTFNLINNYSLLEKRILNYANKIKRKHAGLRFLLDFIEKIPETGQDDDTNIEAKPKVSEMRTLYVFKLLTCLCPCPPAISALKAVDDSWRANKEEVQSEFILHVQNDSELQNKLAIRKQKFAKYGLKEQPLLIVIGEESVDACYILISEIYYPVTSVIQGLDLVFKSFYALQLDYPKSALYPWLIIQNLVFDVKGETDVVYPSVGTLISDLRKIL